MRRQGQRHLRVVRGLALPDVGGEVAAGGPLDHPWLGDWLRGRQRCRESHTHAVARHREGTRGKIREGSRAWRSPGDRAQASRAMPG